MASYKTEDIRNVTLVGHSGSGKTMLAEAMLLQAKEINRLGSIADGNTVCDFDADEKGGQKSYYPSICHLDWKDKRVNVIDTPGYSDFLGGMVSGLAAADCAILTVNAMSGVEIFTRKAWERAKIAGVPVVIVITRMDGENIQALEVVESLREVFGAACTPINLPVGSGSNFSGVVDLRKPVDSPPDGLLGDASAAREQLMETVISGDEELMMRYLEEEEISDEEIAGAFTTSLLSGDLVPVLFCASEKDLGVDALLDAIADFIPNPVQNEKRLEPAGEASETRTYAPSADGPLRAQVFRIATDDFVGKVSHIRVYSGTLSAGGSVPALNLGKSVKINKLYRFQGKDQEEVSEGICGDIVATAKVDDLRAGETLAADSGETPCKRPQYPLPMVSRAVEPKSRGDEGKIGENLRRLSEEDPTFRWEQVAATSETVMSGMGERHLAIMLSRLQRRGVDVSTRLPKIQYKETIAGTADVRYRHKKQTGGAGQFAQVSIKVAPNERDAGYEFIDEIFGGAISQNFRPSVDKGIQDRMTHGIVAGFAVVDVKVTLYDGKEHPVDSKDIAFQIAGRHAIKEAVMKAKPILLEPIVRMEIAVPARYYGDITGDISAKRGRVTGSDQLGDLNLIHADVPAAEVQQYSTMLQALTAGEGSYTMEPCGYEVVPSNVAQAIIAEGRKSLHADED